MAGIPSCERRRRGLATPRLRSQGTRCGRVTSSYAGEVRRCATYSFGEVDESVGEIDLVCRRDRLMGGGRFSP
jgi:hypothetical protein